MPGAKPDDVRTYGLIPHPNDPGRQIIKLNFFGNEPQDWRNREQVEYALTGLVQGKELLDDLLHDQSSQYVGSFRSTRLDVPVEWDEGTRVRYMRVISAYRSLLARHLPPPGSLARAELGGLTNPGLRRALAASGDHAGTAAIFGRSDRVHWDEARSAWTALGQAVADKKKDKIYSTFYNDYAARHGGGGAAGMTNR